MLVLFSFVFSILNMVKNSTLEAKLELEVENVKSLEANLSNTQSQLELEIETREKENKTLFDEIDNIKSFVNYTGINTIY